MHVEEFMYEKISKIKIGSYKLPIKCDINILATIQEEFGTLSNFERKLLGMVPILNEDGSIKEKSDGTIDFKYSEPSFRAIGFALPLFIREGIWQAEQQGENYDEIDWMSLVKDADFEFIEIALALNKEFERCFHRKKKTNLKNPKSQSQSK